MTLFALAPRTGYILIIKDTLEDPRGR
jgi:hypothetical protein